MWLGYLRETFRTWSSGGKSTPLLFSIPFTFPFFRLHLELLFIREDSLEPLSTLATSVGMQSFGMLWFHENTNSTSSFLLPKRLYKRFYMIIAPYAAILNRIIRLVTCFRKSLWLNLQFCIVCRTVNRKYLRFLVNLIWLTKSSSVKLRFMSFPTFSVLLL